MVFTSRGNPKTKDNLLKRNWLGSIECVFCHHNEIISCSSSAIFARSIWSCIYVASDLYPPISVTNMWLHGIDHMFRTLIRVGELAVIWSL
jgi:hypothetical protein